MSNSESDKISAIAEAHIDRNASDYRENFYSELEWLLEGAESPIEKIMGAALLAGLREEPLPYPCDARRSDDMADGSPSIICSQARLGRYRIDFYIQTQSAAGWVKVAVECDGHDFHERTKEQAKRDRQKDRWLQSHGVTIFRFTGSEIWATPEKCAGEVVTFLSKRTWA